MEPAVPAAASAATPPPAAAPPASTADAPAKAAASRPRISTFSSLSYPNYRLLFVGTMGMSAGQWVQQVTLGWLLYDITGSAVLLGALNGLRALPFLFLGPIAGVTADRFDRKKVVAAVALVIMVTAFIMGGVVLAGGREVWYLFAFTAVTGTAWAFNQPARQSLISETVPRSELMNAIALTSAGFNTNKLLAPVVGGMLIGWFGAGGNFLVQGLAYLVVFVTVMLMVIPPQPKQTKQDSLLANLREGLAYVAKDQMVLTLMASALVPQLLAMPYLSLMPVFQKDVLQLGPDALGLMLGAPAIGALVATLTLASLAGRLEHKGRVLLVSMVAWGFCLFLFSRSTSLPFAVLSLIGVGACQVTYNSTNNTILQMIVPAELRGRVMSIYFLDQGLQPAGALMGGIATAQLGAPMAVSLMGASVILLGLFIALRVPRLRSWTHTA